MKMLDNPLPSLLNFISTGLELNKESMAEIGALFHRAGVTFESFEEVADALKLFCVTYGLTEIYTENGKAYIKRTY